MRLLLLLAILALPGCRIPDSVSVGSGVNNIGDYGGRQNVSAGVSATWYLTPAQTELTPATIRALRGGK